MSHQSGIQPSQKLNDAFQQAVTNDNVRIMRISIEEESLNPSATFNVSGDWIADFPRVLDYLEDRNPCYLLYRTDEKRAQGYMWAFMTYVPDYAKVRDKMLYASTRATLKKALGDYRFSDDVYGTHKEEFSYEGFLKFRESAHAAAPLTDGEVQMAQRRKEESGADVGITTKRAHVHGVAFPMTSDAQSAVSQFASGSLNYVQLNVDVEREQVGLVLKQNVNVSEIAGLTADNEPRYHLFRFHHAFEDSTLDSIVFIYSCPMSSKVKERMLYSSCKEAAMVGVEALNISIEKKSEVSDGSEITEAFVFEELHPKQVDEKKAFKKPSRPGTRAPSRAGRTAADE